MNESLTKEMRESFSLLALSAGTLGLLVGLGLLAARLLG